MADADELTATVRATLALLGVAETTLVVSATIHRAAHTTRPRSLPSMPLGGADLVPVGELGRGGMGVVHLAEQRSLDREVAVKVAAFADPTGGSALVREARIMGGLEHPNVVPVHSLGVDESTGAPMLVMKRIDGVTWSTLLANPAHPGWGPLLTGHGDRLRANVEILVHVTRALAFAHDRGVVHRDVKPDNVMVGRFGEVYLLDWGTALRLSERATERPGLVGTPGYLAPEMALGDPTHIDAQTDVYLLGGTLYEVLAGRMPHDAETALLALVAALSGELPPMPASAPAELIDLLRRAMAADKTQRVASAEAFREELARFLASWEAATIVADARVALTLAAEALRVEGPTSTGALRFLVEARFGFTLAHRMRPDDPAITAGLDQSVVGLVERELAAQSPAAARALLPELTRPPAELVRRIEALEQELGAEGEAAAELARTRREADLSRMVTPFVVSVGLVVAGCLVVGGRIASGSLHGTEGVPVAQVVILDLCVLLLLSVGLFIQRRTVFANVASRRIVLTWVVCVLGLLASDAVSFALGRSSREAAAHVVTMLCVANAFAAVTVSARLLAVLPVSAGFVVGIVALPRFAHVFSMLAIAVNGISFVWALRARAASKP